MPTSPLLLARWGRGAKSRERERERERERKKERKERDSVYLFRRKRGE